MSKNKIEYIIEPSEHVFKEDNPHPNTFFGYYLEDNEYPRYMTKKGWVVSGCHWYESKEELENDLEKFGQIHLPTCEEDLIGGCLWRDEYL